jgi:hypothetical protein
LKTLGRRRIELPRCFEGAIALDVSAVALEAKSSASPKEPALGIPPGGDLTGQEHPSSGLPAFQAKDLRAFACELPACELDPIGISNGFRRSQRFLHHTGEDTGRV